ncbi:MAG: transcription repressor NadR [Clostridiales Family XIII bacterium]|jgi:transcriptional regulator of NAD metabolism|nr:transcription repressor NadR [Clostridiales Family XIII bacterium]
MESEGRRREILKMIEDGRDPISAAVLAGRMGVSRQIIVGDVALLRAQGNAIIATSRGYMMSRPVTGRYIGKVACRHGRDATERELSSVVALGGEVLDVIVTHRYYGDLTGQLNIASPEDVRHFMDSVGAGREGLLSELTDGVHLHTVACKDRQTFDAIVAELKNIGVLFKV